MTNEIAKKRKTAIEAMAVRLQVSTEQLQKTLFATAFKECKTKEEFVAAVIVANTYQLNPLLGEIYAFPSKKGGVTPIVPIDGWIKLMNTHKNATGEFDHDGVELIENRAKEGQKNISKTDVDSITAKIFTKGKTNPTVVTEYMIECYDGSKGPWQKWPIRMLRHKALIQCARVAYGFSGIYEPDEGERIVEAQMTEIPEIEMPQPKNAIPAPVSSVSPDADDISEEEKAEIIKKEEEQAQSESNTRKVKRNADRPLI